MNSPREQALVFDCLNEELLGIIHHVEQPCKKGVLIVVGGPQYRVGSHRQFLLLARHLARHGIPVMRFDYRGMGDSAGAMRTFENIEEDLRTALDVFCREVEGLEEVVLWGLCDAASASLFYAHADHRVTGLILLNPWVRTEAGEAKAYLKHYYISRLFSKSFWQKVLSGKFRVTTSVKSLADLSRSAMNQGVVHTGGGSAPLPERMLAGLKRYSGSVLVILSGDDLTAGEFRDLIGSSREWNRALKDRGTLIRELKGANHTFSSQSWRQQVEAWTLEWVREQG